MSRISLMAIVLLAGCQSSSPILKIDTAALQVPIVLTERQKQECAIELQAGESKTQALARAMIEIDDCNAKRMTLANAIEQRNAEIKKASDEEAKRLQQK